MFVVCEAIPQATLGAVWSLGPQPAGLCCTNSYGKWDSTLEVCDSTAGHTTGDLSPAIPIHGNQQDRGEYVGPGMVESWTVDVYGHSYPCHCFLNFLAQHVQLEVGYSATFFGTARKGCRSHHHAALSTRLCLASLCLRQFPQGAWQIDPCHSWPVDFGSCSLQLDVFPLCQASFGAGHRLKAVRCSKWRPNCHDVKQKQICPNSLSIVYRSRASMVFRMAFVLPWNYA